ncbi:MAG: hypothetical protein MJ229_00210 [bacterium]|nr:hypothetical protein [bacterium]
MDKKKYKKLWIIEKYNQYNDRKCLLAVLDSRLSYEKVIFAMKILIMGDNSNNFGEILNVHHYAKDELEYPHQFLNYPIIIVGNSQYYKAPYRAWLANLNLKTGKYTDIEIAFKEYREKFNLIHLNLTVNYISF